MKTKEFYSDLREMNRLVQINPKISDLFKEEYAYNLNEIIVNPEKTQDEFINTLKESLQFYKDRFEQYALELYREEGSALIQFKKDVLILLIIKDYR